MDNNLEELHEQRNNLLDVMSSPYCDQFAFILASEKLDVINQKIESDQTRVQSLKEEAKEPNTKK